ncbi:MAG: agmatinase [Candidatus Hecatellales archaeon]|nr:MAG: agmatinase [Candidatus Hecatellales archaeon]
MGSKTLGRLVSPTVPFAGIQEEYGKAKYVIFGFPYDLTSTYRLGSRQAPQAVREASLNLETFSPRTGLFLEKLAIRDLGDLDISALENPFDEASKLFRSLLQEGKTPVVLGGEHTLTFSTVRGLPENVAVIIFDAHLDFRDRYEGRSFSHTTYLRRLVETYSAERFIVVGARALSLEEVEASRKAGLQYLSTLQILRKGVSWALKKVEEFFRDFSTIYISLDLDVFDPAYAPAASNPEPEGLTPTMVLDLLEGLTSRFPRVAGFDVVEFSPAYDNGVTALLAAKMVFELLCMVEASGGEADL